MSNLKLDEIKKNIYNNIDNLLLKYNDDEDSLNILTNYIQIQLPEILINKRKILLERRERKDNLLLKHKEFMNLFLKENQYYYSSSTEIYFTYNQINYFVIKEDDIIYNILSSIGNKSEISPWKYKIKTSIIKSIKEQFIWNSIPESQTIQNIIDLLIKYFNNKNEVKYFLTIIGDIFLKKNNSYSYLINSNSKNLIKLINYQFSLYFGQISFLNFFKHKIPNSHNIKLRLINFTNNQIEIFNSNDSLIKNIINLIIVSFYYSNKYGDSDNFIIKSFDENLESYALLFKNFSYEDLINNFLKEKFESCNNVNCTSKNMNFLLKTYFDEIHIPSNFIPIQFKTILQVKLIYDSEKDLYKNITSKSLPLVSNFIKFWEDNLIYDESEFDLEISEICLLFKKYCIGKNSDLKFNENTIINLINHFFPNITIENNLFINNYNCNLWNKKNELITFINYIQNMKNETESNNLDGTESNNLNLQLNNNSYYSLYNYYCKNYKKNDNKIGKRYFEKFLYLYI